MRVLLDAATAPVIGNASSVHELVADSTYVVDVTGSPTSVILDIEGSLDGVNFFQLAQHTMVSNLEMFHIVGKPVLFHRVNLTTLVGGTSPTVSVLSSLGFRT